MHTGLGALQGAIVDGKNGAIAGAIGAGIAETIADVACPKPPSLDDILKIESQQGRPLTHDEFTAAWNQQLAQYLKQTYSIADASKMIATAVAALAQQDINIAYDTATKAVDNNFLILVGYGIVTAGVAYSAYQINNAYKEGGPQAALQQLGIEVVTQVAFGTAIKIGFKVGHAMYPTAKAAIAVVLESTPGLKFALGELADTLAVAGNKIASTRFGTVVNNLNQCVNQLETKIVIAENKIIDKVKNKIVDNVNKHLNPSFAEDLVEHVVPNSVISQVEKQLVDKAAKESINASAQTAVTDVAPSLQGSPSVVTQDVSLSLAEMAQQEIVGKNNQQDILNKHVEELFKTVSHERPGRLITIDTPYLKRLKIETFTQDFYNTVRATTTDVTAISKNTNISEHIIQRIKNHVFLEDHIFLQYGGRVGKFDIDENMAAAWQRLINNKYVKSDLILLQHEYAEACKMNGIEVPYEKAHDLVNTLYDWNNSF